MNFHENVRVKQACCFCGVKELGFKTLDIAYHECFLKGERRKVFVMTEGSNIDAICDMVESSQAGELTPRNKVRVESGDVCLGQG